MHVLLAYLVRATRAGHLHPDSDAQQGTRGAALCKEAQGMAHKGDHGLETGLEQAPRPKHLRWGWPEGQREGWLRVSFPLLRSYIADVIRYCEKPANKAKLTKILVKACF